MRIPAVFRLIFIQLLLLVATSGASRAFAETHGSIGSTPETDSFAAALENVSMHRVRQNLFCIRRQMPKYLNNLPVQAFRKLESLGPNDHVIDMGAGKVFFLEQYLTPSSKTSPAAANEVETIAARLRQKPASEKARATAITFNPEREVPDFDGRLRVLKGRLLNQIPPGEIEKAPFGKADLILDLFGVFSYATEVDKAIATDLGLLKPNGEIYLYCGQSGWPEPPAVQASKVHTLDGRDLTLVQWLQSRVKGARTEIIEEPIRDPDTLACLTPVQRQVGRTFTLKLTRKPNEAVHVPLLKQCFSDGGAPPVRRYYEVRSLDENPCPHQQAYVAMVRSLGKWADELIAKEDRWRETLMADLRYAKAHQAIEDEWWRRVDYILAHKDYYLRNYNPERPNLAALKARVDEGWKVELRRRQDAMLRIHASLGAQ